MLLLLVGLWLMIGPPAAHAGEWTQVTRTQPMVSRPRPKAGLGHRWEGFRLQQRQ